MTKLDAKLVVQALDGVLGQLEEPAGLHEPIFEGNEWDYVKDCLDTGWVSYVGSYVTRFGEILWWTREG